MIRKLIRKPRRDGHRNHSIVAVALSRISEMSLHLRYLQCPIFNYGPCVSRESFANPMGGLHFQQVMHRRFVLMYLSNACRAITFAHAFPKEDFNGRLRLIVDEEPFKTKCLQRTGSSLEKVKNQKITAEKTKDYDLTIDKYQYEVIEAPDSSKSNKSVTDKEIQRRRKIGLANKGRVPWNKGRKHSEETRERIKKRTVEALSDPKVRKKMSEYPHSHSKQSKARIGISLKRIWGARLKYKKAQEKCYSTWAGGIAEAAKQGDHGQQELDWNSYEKMKAEITAQLLQQKADKAREKEISRLRAERAARDRAENAAKLSQQTEERKQAAKARELKALARGESANTKEEKAISRGLKLKTRLTKFHRRKRQLESLVGIPKEIAIEPHPVLKKLDVELIKIEKLQREVSLADQIRAAKNSKVELIDDNIRATPSSDSFVEIRGVS